MILPLQAHAATPLDEIQNYAIQVDMRRDGTMDIRYHIEWKVLNDTSEGPLSWVKIGIPNKNANEVAAFTSNIDKIELKSSGNLSYAYIYFDKDYYANDIVTFEFSIHQSNMYVIEKEEHILRYSFTPGWFDEIEVKNLTLRWNADNVLKTNPEPQKEGNYYVWNDSLTYGEKYNISVYYNLDVFEATEEGQAKEESNSDAGSVFAIIIIIIVIIFVILLLIAIFSDDGYGGGSGFAGSRTYHSTYIRTGGSRSSCACVSSCACACACAGGGRAGCSKKDFYHTNVRVDTLTKVLEEE